MHPFTGWYFNGNQYVKLSSDREKYRNHREANVFEPLANAKFFRRKHAARSAFSDLGSGARSLIFISSNRTLNTTRLEHRF